MKIKYYKEEQGCAKGFCAWWSEGNQKCAIAVTGGDEHE